MNRIITICAAILMTFNILLPQQAEAQAPEKLSYQAVVRNSSNELVANSQVGMQISMLQGSASGSVVYLETQTPKSNANGLVSIEIGTGAGGNGDFTTIDWANGPFFIKTETDPTGGSNYTITGISQLMSVPYALYAKSSSDTDAVAENTAKVGYSNDLVSANPDVLANTSKVGITPDQANAITENTAKVGYTDDLVSANPDVVANTAKVGISTDQANAIAENTSKVGYTDDLVSANPDVVANTAKVGITSEQADAITENNTKMGYTDDLVSANPDVVANTAKVGITTDQANAITENTAKVGYTDDLVSVNPDVVANTAKVGITTGPQTIVGQKEFTDDLTVNRRLNVRGDIRGLSNLIMSGDAFARRFSTISDRRFKKNIKPITGSLDILKQIGGYHFEWKEISNNSGNDIGVIAQELEKVLPEVVVTREDGYKAVSYPKIVALLIETNKELLKRIEILESKVN